MSERRSPVVESVRIVLPLLILVAASGGFYVLASRQQQPDREEPKNTSPLVETVSIQGHEEGLDIEVDGLVVPYREIHLSAEVEGRVTHKAKVCRAGRYVKQGELLIEIDSRDYDIEIRRLKEELDQATNSIKELEVEVASTESLIELAEAELKIQHEEYERLEDLFEETVVTQSEIDQVRRTELIAKTAVLGLRNQLQLKSTSRGRLESARDRASVLLEKAALDLSRTKITAPVDGVVVVDSVEEDSYVKKGEALVTIEDTSAVEVKCNLRMDELAWIWRPTLQTIAGQEQAGMAGDYAIRETPVTVVYRLGDRDCEWRGSLCRYDGIGLDETTRTVPCRVVVANPTDGRSTASAAATPDGCPPALVRGMFVTVRIHVGGQTDLLSVPSAAVRPGGRLWLVDDGKMQLVHVSIVSILDGRVLIRAGDPHPEINDKVIVSALPFAANGMAVRESPES
jgi:multidrug efflux pump subunit AcrA (membrane-fusion protein)